MIKILADEPVVIPLEKGQIAVRVVSRPVSVERQNTKDKLPDLPPKPTLAAGEPSESSPFKPTEPIPAVSADPPKQKSPRSAVRVVTGPAYPQAVKRTGARRSLAKAPSQDAKVPKAAKPDTGPVGWGPVTAKPSPTPGGGEGGERSRVTRRAMPISRPEFNLTQRFPELAKVEVKVEFKIAEDGSCEPLLLTSSGNLTADVTIKARLAEFEWRPALDKGVPIPDTRIMDISLDDS